MSILSVYNSFFCLAGRQRSHTNDVSVNAALPVEMARIEGIKFELSTTHKTV